MRAAIERLGAGTGNLLLELGRIASFGGLVALAIVRPPFWLLRQIGRAHV